MSNSILDYVLQCLQNAGFPAFAAYPGQRAPEITEAVATAHIHKTDSRSQTVTVEVILLCPAHLGGTFCELTARKAVSALLDSRAACIQNGCVYDSVAQVYSVSILATYCGITGADQHSLGPGFLVKLNGVSQPWVVNFTEEKVQKQTMEYVSRIPEAIAITPGSYYWNIQLEELFPAGVPETAGVDGEFSLRVIRHNSAQIYTPCRWTSVSRCFTAEGLRRISKGIALARKEGIA